MSWLVVELLAEQTDPLRACFPGFLGWTQSNLYSRARLASLQRCGPAEHSVQCPLSYKVSRDWWIVNPSRPCENARDCSAYCSPGVPSLVPWRLWSLFSKRLQGTPLPSGALVPLWPRVQPILAASSPQILTSISTQ